MTNQKKISFLCPYPQGEAPSQRFRYEQYLHLLEKHHYTFKIFPFLDNETNSIIYKKGNTLKKIWGIFKGFIRRFIHLFKIKNSDYIFIHREASPIGPPIFEWIISKILKKKIIYDFDDAVWIPNTSSENKIISFLKWNNKISSICKWSYKTSCGNLFLLEYAKKFNSNSFYNPTTIDTIGQHNKIKIQDSEVIVIGWTGTHSTLKYLDNLIPVLQQLEQKYFFTFLVIADKDPQINLKSFQFLRWNKETEIDDLLSFNIGIMPLLEDEWSKGKCGFKALQYMSLGIPPVVSDVGANNTIISHSHNGYLCKTSDDWIKHLSILIEDVALRKKIGVEARKKIESDYCVKSNENNFLSLFS